MSSTQQSTRTYVIDRTRTTAEFTVKAMFGASTVRGTFAVTSGTAIVGPRLVRLTAVLDATSVDTGNTRRDKDLRTRRFLAVADHPELQFTGEGIPAVGAEITGLLTVAGVSAEVLLRIDEITPSTVRASTRLDRTDFVLGKRGLIGRNVDVRLRVALVPAP